jgi:putative heme iron utilization protein
MADASPVPPAVTARGLLRGLDRAVLATTMAGRPYASLVLYATTPKGEPLLLISDLAQHTMNIKDDAAVSLLLDGTGGLDEPLTGPRVSLMGRAVRSDDPALRGRFVARHPSAGFYAGFADFHLYRVTVERAHLVAGFGRIDWIEAADLLPPDLDALAASEGDIVRHMNQDHADAVQLYATTLLGQSGDGWALTGVDAEGADLRRGGTVARLPFGAPAHDAAAVRHELARLAAEARRGAGG